MDPTTGEEIVGTQSSALTSYAARVLLITDLSVVDNSKARVPNGYRVTDPCDSVAGDEDRAWNIGHMLKREAQKNGVAPATYVTKWLDAWTTTGGAINGQTIPLAGLEGAAVRAAWARLGGESRLEKAPFKLLAIVNRIDLRNVRPFGEPLGGEIRFVFAPIGVPATGPITCPSRASDVSTIILEYSPAKGNENAVLDWAQRWHALGALPFDGTYRHQLSVLTEEVINSGRLMRIRTNEGPPGTAWMLTEFEHDPVTKFLKRSTIKQSPTEALHTQTSVPLGGWIRDNVQTLQSLKPQMRSYRRAPVHTYALPDRFPGTTTWLRGSFNKLNGTGSGNFWNATMPTGMFVPEWDEARHLFSLATCSGCHGNETATGFLHISNNHGGPAALSAFLSGSLSVTDPVSGTVREFDEMSRRQDDLHWLLTGGWVGVPVFRNEHSGGQSAATSYKMVFKHSLKCLDVEGGSSNDGALVKQFACHGNGNQRLALIDRTQSAVSVVVKHSGKCLDVENASTANLARVVQRTCNGSASQKLAMWFSASQTGRILKFEHSGKCLRVKTNSSSDGAEVVQDTCDSGSADDRSFMFVE